MTDGMLKRIVVFAIVSLAACTLANGGEYSREYSVIAGKPFLLGPTGIRAYGPHGPGRSKLTQRGHEIRSDFVVTSIDPNAPAVGFVFPQDVVVGANGKRFLDGGDPRVDLGWAIIDSEGVDGKLRLAIVRGGKEREVTIRIPAIGKHSATWPLDCPRTDRMIADACRYIAEEQMPDGHIPADEGFVGTVHSGLFLLGTGDPTYLENARRVCHWFINHITTKEKEGKRVGWGSWFGSYGGILLAEYYHMTGDRSVLPGLELCAKQIAKGQMPSGSWGHGYSDGLTAGYGEMNNAGLACWIALESAREAGVKVDAQALNKARDFFGRFAVPLCSAYGDHAWRIEGYATANGHIAEMAVGHWMKGDKETAGKFALKVARGFDRVEDGHTGCYFNVVWSPIAASLASPDEYRKAMDQFGWYYALSRTPRGGFFCQYGGDNLQRTGSEYSMVGPNMTAGGIGLALVAPRRHLRIFGAPRSVFLRTDLPKPLEEARKKHLANDWAGCQAAVKSYMLKRDLNAEIARLCIELSDKSRYVQANVETTLAKLESMVSREKKLSRLDQPSYEIHLMLPALRWVLGNDNPRLNAIAAELYDDQTPLYARGKAYYESCRFLKAQSFEPWWVYGRMAQAATRELVPKRLPLPWQTLADTAESKTFRTEALKGDAGPPAGWTTAAFDDSRWTAGMVKGDTTAFAAVLMRCTFNLDSAQADALRVSLQGSLPSGTRMYLNGEEVLVATSPFKGNVDLLPIATELLSKGTNVLSIQATGKMKEPKVKLDVRRAELTDRFKWSLTGQDAKFRKLSAQRRRPTPYYDPEKDTRTVDQTLADLNKVSVFMPDLHGSMERLKILLGEKDVPVTAAKLLKSPSWGGRLVGLTLVHDSIKLPRNYHKLRQTQQAEADAEVERKLPAFLPLQKDVSPLLKDSNILVRAQAVAVLASYGMEARDALPQLVAMLKDAQNENWWVRRPAWEAIWRMDPDLKTTEEIIRATLTDRSSPIYNAGLSRTTRVKDKDARIKAMTTFKDELVAGVFDAPLSMWTRACRKSIAVQLKDLGKDEIRPYLDRFYAPLSHPNPKSSALQGSMEILAWFGEESMGKLETLADGKDRLVQRHALATLAKMAAQEHVNEQLVAKIVTRLEAATKSDDIELVRTAKNGLKEIAKAKEGVK